MIILIYIYCIYFPTSNKYYVGQTYNLKRLFGHLNSKYLVGQALRKYNDWQVTILHTCKTRDQANLLEIEEIRNFNSVAPSGYNLTRGGEGAGLGNKNGEGCRTEKTKETMRGIKKPGTSKAMRGNQNAKGKNLENKNAEGCKRSEKWKKEKSKQMQGNKYAEGNQNALKNGKYTKKAKIKRLQTRIAKLEEDWKDERNNDA